MKRNEHADFWMILAVLACLAGSVPRGIGEPIPAPAAEGDCWFAGLPGAIECVVTGAAAGADFGLRLFPLLHGLRLR